jgi:hypothetical protein
MNAKCHRNLLAHYVGLILKVQISNPQNMEKISVEGALFLVHYVPRRLLCGVIMKHTRNVIRS